MKIFKINGKNQKGAFINLLNNISQSVLSLILGVFLARGLMPTKMGRYQTFVALTSIFFSINGFGLGQASLYYLNSGKEKKENIFPCLFWSTIFYGVIFFIFLVLGLWETDKCFFSNNNFILFFYGAGASLFSSGNIFSYLILAKIEIKKLFVANLFWKGIPLIIIGVFVFISKITISLALFSISLGFIAYFLYIFKDLKDLFLGKGLLFNFKILKKFLVYGTPLSIYNLFLGFFGSGGIIVLKIYFPENLKEIAFLGRALAISSLVFILPGSLGPILYSSWSKRPKNVTKHSIIKALTFNGILGLIGMVVLFFFSNFIVFQLYGKDFLPVSPILKILAVSVFFKSMFDVFFNYSISQGYTLPMLKVISIGGFLVLMAMLFVVNQYHAKGIACCIVMGNIILFWLGYLEVKRIRFMEKC